MSKPKNEWLTILEFASRHKVKRQAVDYLIKKDKVTHTKKYGKTIVFDDGSYKPRVMKFKKDIKA